MQQNNKNMNIANELDVISRKITELDKSDVGHAIAEIHKAHLEIEQIARKHELSTLLAVIHWLDLNIELDDVNAEQITTLLLNDCYSNWIDVFVSLLKDYNDKLMPILHQTLTSPNWVIKPSMIILKDVASWVGKIKTEAENVPQIDEETSQNPECQLIEISNDEILIDVNCDVTNNETEEATISDLIDDIIDNQVLKAEKAGEESLIKQTVFEEIDRDILEKDYATFETSEDIVESNQSIEELAIPLMETEKSSIDDDDFEQINVNPTNLDIDLIDEDMLVEEDILSENQTIIEALLNSTDTDTVKDTEDVIYHEGNGLNLGNELTDIHNALTSIQISKPDVFSNRDSFTKQLDRLALIVESSNLSTVAPIIDWCQRNLMLFEDNSTTKVEQFIISGDVWSWIEQLASCFKNSDVSTCLNDLSNCLMNKVWLEPVDTNDLQALLISLKSAHSNEATDTIEDSESDKLSAESIEQTSNKITKDSLSELLIDSILVENSILVKDSITDSDKNEEQLIEKQTSGLQMTWDDEIHPELLMVYLEETPTQVDELITLLDKISNQKANKEEKNAAARLAHTIKGGSAVVGISALAGLSGHLETLLDHSVTAQLNSETLKKLPEIGGCIKATFDAVQLQGEEPIEFLEIFNHLEAYDYDFDEEIAETKSSVIDKAVELIETESNQVDEPVQIDEIVNFVEAQEEVETDLIDETIEADIKDKTAEVAVIKTDLVDEIVEVEEVSPSIETETTEVIESIEEIKTEAKEVIVSEKSNFQMNWNDETHPELLMVYLEETPTQINELIPLLHKISENKADADEKHTASRMAHTIKGGSAIVGITTLSEISYRLETLLDHSVKHQLPTKVLETLPKAAKCLEDLFDAVQMQDEEPAEYFAIFTQLDTFVDSIDDFDDEPLELPTLDLPDFIINQNKGTDDQTNTAELDIDSKSDSEAEAETEEITADKLSENENDTKESDIEDQLNAKAVEVEAEIKEDKTDELVEAIEAASEIEIEIKEENTNEIVEVETETELVVTEVEETNEVKESVEVETVKLDQLRSKGDVNNIIIEIDDIVLNLIGHGALSKDSKAYAEQCSIELQRFELVTDLSGYPELSLLSQWCQSNLESYAKRKNKKFTTFINSNEIWSWVEHVGACLRESDDMSHMSSLSVELMREEWLKAIKMEDLQTVLLALRHLEDTETTESIATTSIVDENNENEVISWDKDIHPELLAVYFQETPDQIDHVAGLLHKIARGESNTTENKEAARIAHTIKGSSGVVGLNSLLELTHYLEDILDYSVNNDIDQETAELLSESSDCMESLFETIQNKQAAPEELTSVLKSLSLFSEKLKKSDNTKTSPLYDIDDTIDENDEVQTKVAVKTSNETEINTFTKNSATSTVDLNEAYIRVPIKVIDKLLNLAGELVTTSNQVSDNLAKTQETGKTIRNQDDRVITMLTELNKTIEQQEKDQQHLFSSLENSDFDSLEMDSYNELNSVASLLSESIVDSQEIDDTLNKQLDELTEKLHSLDKLNKTFSDVILSSRMVSINTIVPRLERIVRQTCRKTNKKAQLKVIGNDINVDTDILNNLVDPLLHMLRNSIDHGIETPAKRIKKGKDEIGLIELKFSREGNNILMTLTDDGAGIDPNKIYQKALEKELITADQEVSDSETISLILQPGFTTQDKVTNISGRGVGMDVVNTSIQDLNGSLSIASDLGESTSFKLTIPLTLITNTTLLVKVEDNTIAIPTDTIEQILYQEANTLIERENELFVSHLGEEIKTQSLGELLAWPHQMIDPTRSYNVLIIKTDENTHAVHVDSIVSSREVVVKRLNPWISPAKGVIGACHLNDGGVAPVINLVSVIKAAASIERTSATKPVAAKIIKPEVKKQILVVDDSLSNRKALSLIIDKTDYDVVTAVDGLDALRVMNENPIDLVFTDLEMPRMNGLELTQSIRAWNDKSNIPIVMITSRTTNKHRELAQKAGVDDYLTKPVETETLLIAIDTWLTHKEALEV